MIYILLTGKVLLKAEKIVGRVKSAKIWGEYITAAHHTKSYLESSKNQRGGTLYIIYGKVFKISQKIREGVKSAKKAGLV